MRQCERWAQDYLKSRGIPREEIVFEPNGPCTFPDFEVSGRIGVEVRRLNQHVKHESGEWESLEKLSRPLQERFSKLLRSFGPATESQCWWVHYSFRRPQITKNWQQVLRAKLSDFLNTPRPGSDTRITVDEHFRVSLIPRCSRAACLFTLGGNSDWDSGGWVDNELQKNLALCIEEKTRKREAFKMLYPEWWLILIDYFNGGEPGNVEIRHDWDKVVVVHPESYSCSYEVPSHGSRSQTSR